MQRSGFLELVPYGAILLSIAVLMMLEPHMSGTILIMLGGAAVLFAAGIKLYWFVGGAAGLAGLLLLMMSGYQSTRIKIWQDPWNDGMNGRGTLPRSSSPCSPLAPADFWGWAWARAGRNSIFCLSRRTTSFLRWSVRSLDWWGPA